MVAAAQCECYDLEMNCSTSGKEKGSTFYWVARLISLRGDKEDFPLNPGFAKTSFVPQCRTLGSNPQGELGA